MGFDGSRPKKKFLKHKFKTCFVYYFNDKSYILNSNPHNPNEIHLHDGSIDHEMQLSISNKLCKRFDGAFIFNKIYMKIIDYLINFNTNIFTFDLHYRPPVKDIDTTRSYSSNSRFFEVVDDKHFPLCEDVRRIKLNKIKKCLKKLRNQKSKTKKGAKKGKKNNLAIKYAFNTQIKDLINSMEEVDLEIKNNPKDIWKEGKGVPQNRMMVYSYYTQKFIDRIKKCPCRDNSLLVIDGAVRNNCYVALNIQIPEVNNDEDDSKIPVNCDPKECSMLGEGEQSIMYHINQKFYFEKKERFVIHSTDTDTYTYIGLFYGIINFLKKEGNCSSLKLLPHLFIRSKNFYYKKTQKNGENSNKIYYVDNLRMNQIIHKEYSPYIKNALITYWVYYGIFFGCDFIVDVHKTFQKPNQKDESTIEFLNFWFEEELKSKSKKVDMSVEVKMNKSTRYTNGLEYNVKLNKPVIFFTMKKYLLMKWREAEKKKIMRKLKKSKGPIDRNKVLEMLLKKKEKENYKKIFPRDQRVKLLMTCLNTEYVAHYMINQYRLRNARDRKTLLNCCEKDCNGRDIYGYTKVDGKIVQSTFYPLQYKKLILDY